MITPVALETSTITMTDGIILIASPEPQLLASWEDALEGFGDVVTVRKLEALKQACTRIAPRILLLDHDLPGLHGSRGVVTIRNAYPNVKIVVLTSTVSDEGEIALFKIGVRGCALRNIEPQLLKRIVLAIEQGELWMRRALPLRMLDELRGLSRHQSPKAQSANEFNALTDREREIASLVGSGQSNKEIARELGITERTVKEHVSRVFRKLRVGDRVLLALSVAAHREAEHEWQLGT